MATSPLFGWEEPDDTDLVKDGAAAIRTLGNAIDTSMGDLLGGSTGQVLSKASNANMDFTWVAQDDSNAIQNAIVDAKGDLIAATANDTPARLAVGNNGETLVADSSTSTGLKWAQPKIVQIVNASTTTQVSVTTNTPTDTTLTATITPRSASNKILIFVSQNGVLKEAANTSAVINLLRGSTQIARFANYAGLTVTSVVNGVGTGGAGSYLDSPATTSATTYKTQFYSEANINGVIVQHGGIMSTITLMEVTP